MWRNGAQSPDELRSLRSPEKASSRISALSSARLITSVSSIAEGYAIGVMSGAFPILEDDLDLSKTQTAWLVGIANIFIAVGAPLGGSMADCIGRVSSLIVGYVLIITGAVLMAVASSYGPLMTGRVIEAIGVGVGLAVVTTYMSEVSPRRIRGQLPSLEELFIVIGVTLGLFANCAFLGIRNDWRWMLGLGGAIPTIFLIPLVFGFLPESPRYLAMLGKEEEALDSLAAFVDEEERDEVRQSWSKADAELRNWSEVLRPANSVDQKMLLASMFVMCMQFISGVHILAMYLGPLLADSHGRHRAYLIAAMLGIWRILIILPVTCNIDSLGRRPLLTTSVGGLAASTMLLAAMSGANLGLVPWQIMGYMAFFTAYEVGLGPVSWVYCAEVLENAARSKGVAVAVFVARVYAGGSLIVFPFLEEAVGITAVFCILAVLNIGGFVHIWFTIPETKSVPLESMHKCFNEA